MASGMNPAIFKAHRNLLEGWKSVFPQSRACYFSTCLLERLLLWGDGKGPAGGKWHCLSREARARQLSSYQLCHKQHNYVLCKGCGRRATVMAETLSSAVNRSDGFLSRCLYVSYRRLHVLIYQHTVVAASMQFKVWQHENVLDL